ncbi:hypothetical protein QNN00_11660 [Bacillus velezensis]|nr:hypothetical protein [Bacillus velezensis]
MAFVAENGAFVVNAGEELFAGNMSEDTIKAVILALEQYEVKNVIVCGKKARIFMKMPVKMNICMPVSIIMC